MRKLVMVMLSFIAITGLLACDTDDVHSPESSPQPEKTSNNNKDDNPEENMKLKITIDTAVFTATLQNNTAAIAFEKLLPMTITMSELNNNEKYYDLQGSLPVAATNPGTISNGDLMLYGSRTLVLFYESFSTSYNYTRLGKIDDTTGLISALGSGNVTIIFESEQKK